MEISQKNLYKLLKLKTLKNKIEHFQLLKGHADLNKKDKNDAEMSRFLLLLVQANTNGDALNNEGAYYFHDPVGTIVRTSANAMDEQELAKSRYHNNQNVWNEFYRIVNSGSVLAKKNLKTEMKRQLEQDSIDEYKKSGNAKYTLKALREFAKREAQNEDGRSGDGYNISNWMNFLELEFALAIYKIEEDLKETHIKVGSPKIYTYKDIAKVRVNHFFKYYSPKTGIGGFARDLRQKMPKVYGKDQTSKNTQKLLDYLKKRKDELDPPRVQQLQQPQPQQPQPQTSSTGPNSARCKSMQRTIDRFKKQNRTVPAGYLAAYNRYKCGGDETTIVPQPQQPAPKPQQPQPKPQVPVQEMKIRISTSNRKNVRISMREIEIYDAQNQKIQLRCDNNNCITKNSQYAERDQKGYHYAFDGDLTTRFDISRADKNIRPHIELVFPSTKISKIIYYHTNGKQRYNMESFLYGLKLELFNNKDGPANYTYNFGGRENMGKEFTFDHQLKLINYVKYTGKYEDLPKPAPQPKQPVEEPEPEPQKPQPLPDILIQPKLPLTEEDEKKPLVISDISQSEEPEIQEEEAKINIQTSKTTVEKEEVEESNEVATEQEDKVATEQEDKVEENLEEPEERGFFNWIFGWIIFLVFLIIKIGIVFGILFAIYYFGIKPRLNKS